ncbi:hypothetical protein VKT23_002707 [Stygiomarasmius scandens]|uniref:Ribosome assembly protein 3 n=1 Tax=Marasmiellus scandens TaxID=2682957 RepID=A0ABR1K2S9_9AGAR
MSSAKPPVQRKRNRKRKRRVEFSSSSSSSSDSSDESGDEKTTTITLAAPKTKEIQPSDSDSSSSSSSSSSDSDSDDERPVKNIKSTDTTRSIRAAIPREPSPPPPSIAIPSFIPENRVDSTHEQEMKEKFKKFWMSTVADGFKDDLEEIRKEPNLTTTKLSLLIDSLASGAEVFSTENVNEVEMVLE